MQSTLKTGLILLLAALITSGCATTDSASQSHEQRNATTQVEAPLGSRIRKKTAINPVMGANRDDVETSRIQQNAEHSRAYQ